MILKYKRKILFTFTIVFIATFLAIFLPKDTFMSKEINNANALESRRFIIEQPLSYDMYRIGYVMKDTKTGSIYIMSNQGGIIKVEE